MRPNVINLIDNDMPDINDKLTAAELQRLRLRFLLSDGARKPTSLMRKPSRAAPTDSSVPLPEKTPTPAPTAMI
jgi:hypothetical protein